MIDLLDADAQLLYFRCMFTSQKTKKRKTWDDGIVTCCPKTYKLKLQKWSESLGLHSECLDCVFVSPRQFDVYSKMIDTDIETEKFLITLDSRCSESDIQPESIDRLVQHKKFVQAAAAATASSAMEVTNNGAGKKRAAPKWRPPSRTAPKATPPLLLPSHQSWGPHNPPVMTHQDPTAPFHGQNYHRAEIQASAACEKATSLMHQESFSGFKRPKLLLGTKLGHINSEKETSNQVFQEYRYNAKENIPPVHSLHRDDARSMVGAPLAVAPGSAGGPQPRLFTERQYGARNNQHNGINDAILAVAGGGDWAVRDFRSHTTGGGLARLLDESAEDEKCGVAVETARPGVASMPDSQVDPRSVEAEPTTMVRRDTDTKEREVNLSRGRQKKRLSWGSPLEEEFIISPREPPSSSQTVFGLSQQSRPSSTEVADHCNDQAVLPPWNGLPLTDTTATVDARADFVFGKGSTSSSSLVPTKAGHHGGASSGSEYEDTEEEYEDGVGGETLFESHTSNRKLGNAQGEIFQVEKQEVSPDEKIIENPLSGLNLTFDDDDFIF